MGYYDDEDSYFSNYDREEQQRWDDIDRENRYQEEQDYQERERQWRVWDDEQNDRRSSFFSNDDDSESSSFFILTRAQVLLTAIPAAGMPAVILTVLRKTH